MSKRLNLFLLFGSLLAVVAVIYATVLTGSWLGFLYFIVVGAYLGGYNIARSLERLDPQSNYNFRLKRHRVLNKFAIEIQRLTNEFHGDRKNEE